MEEEKIFSPLGIEPWLSSLLLSQFQCFFVLVCEAIGAAAIPGLLSQPQRHFCPSQNPTWPDPGLNPGRRGGMLANIFFIIIGLWGYWHCGHSWPIVPALGDSEDDCGEADGM
jgi:hypothetical protein